MKKNLQIQALKGKKKRVMGEPKIVTPEEYQDLAMDVKLELIRELIPLGLMHVEALLQEEIESLAGKRYERTDTPYECDRYGSNNGSVPLAGQRIPIKVPRLRNLIDNVEIPLETIRMLKAGGSLDEKLLLRVLYGISCRNYGMAADSVPGAIGLSASTTSRKMIKATAKKLRELQERDLSDYDFLTMWIDGKTFADDLLVVAMGLTQDGRKVPLGFVQTGTENKKVISHFLQGLLDRGLKIDEGLLVVIDGGKGIRAAVRYAFKDQAIIQRCQWHKRENVVSYLPKNEQEAMRRRLQKAYERPTYAEAKAALMKIMEELKESNLSAAKSLAEGLEETLTLHRLGVFPLLGISLKTTNCIESVFSQVERICRKVSHWKNSSHKQRWLAASLLDIEPRMRRIKGCKHLPLLRERIKDELGIKEVVAVA